MDKQLIITDVELLTLIQRSDERTLNKLYFQYRGKFISWAIGRYRCDETLAGDMFQRSFTILYLNIKNQKITQLTSSLETYLYGIGKNVFREQFNDKLRTLETLDERFEGNVLDFGIIEKHEQRHLKTKLQKFLKSLGEPCSTVLKLYYFCSFSMETITLEVGYKNEEVAKKKKYQCLKGLKESISTQPHLQDDLLNF